MKMPFKDGMYKHELGFTVLVQDGKAFLNGHWPLSVRLTDLFDEKKWRVIENGSKNEG
jgi:uncharacterized membrane protein YfbV (UPF0208 family)